jgi:hypothetical protein
MPRSGRPDHDSHSAPARTQSDIVSDAGVAELRALIPSADTNDVQGTGHMVAGDENDAFTARVLTFLALSLGALLDPGGRTRSLAVLSSFQSR